MLTDAQIKVEAALSGSYTKGCQCYSEGRVGTIGHNPELNQFSAEVHCDELYNVTITFDKSNRIDKYECGCPESERYYGACRHVVAALKAIQHKWDQFYLKEGAFKQPELRMNTGDIQIYNKGTKSFLDYFNDVNSYTDKFSKPETTRIIATYHHSSAGGRKNWLEFVIGSDKLYIMRDVKKFTEALINGQELVFGKQYTFKPRQTGFDDESRALVNLLKNTYIDEMQLLAWSNQKTQYNPFNDPPESVTAFDGKRFKLDNTNLTSFFECMGDRSFNISINAKQPAATKVSMGRPPFSLSVAEADNGIKITADRSIGAYHILDADFRYVFNRGLIYKADEEFSDTIKPVINSFVENRRPEILIPVSGISQFITSILPRLEKVGEIKVSPEVSFKYYKQELAKRVYFDRYKHGVSARIEFKYGDIIVNPAESEADTNVTAGSRILLRDFPEESKVVNIIYHFGFRPTAGIYVQSEDDQIYSFLKEGLDELVKACEVYYSEDFKDIKIKPPGLITGGLRLNTGTDMLEMTLQYSDLETRELISLLSAYKLKKKYFRMKNGSFIALDSAEFMKAASLLEQLSVSQGSVSNDVIMLPKYRAMYLDSITEDKDNILFERDSSFEEMVKDIREPQSGECVVPDGIRGVLRDYQKTGLNWLKSLSNYGLGGILADDMGLGKTLQVITLIMANKKKDTLPSLVVAPTSLLYNWKEEVGKFAPELKVGLISGQQGERLEYLDQIYEGDADIIVTSYGMIKRDIQFYEEKRFEFCFIDEAQHIKNPGTLNARAVKRIKARCYFALTGTPIENTLTELWSIFDFIMPGYLHSHHKFVNQFETPIIRYNDRKVLNELGMHIKPFILRRMKKDVLKELPEKIESKMLGEMTGTQAKVYSAYLLQARKEAEDELKNNGFQRSQIKILSLLTRLRQVCCHPSLFLSNYSGGSGKLDVLTEILEDAIGGGHRILLFSQFTSMLAIIKEKLTSSGMSYFYLDGATKSEERINLVNSFNAGEKDIFLISLKAGGTGLNLTGADMVIHYDPWWNPAVEDQATDRAYRIGQTNSVQVFRLITKGTIEEKIFDLQQRKRVLIDSVIQPGESFLNKMTEEEIRSLFE